MIEFRLSEPHELHPVLCGARRGPRGRVRCSRPALHCHHGFHAGQGRGGRWFFWDVQHG